MKRRWVAGLAAATTAVVTLGLTPSAYAEVGDQSTSSAQFLSGSLLDGIDLSSVAGIDGASASYVDGTTQGSSDVDNAPLDVTALEAVTATLPGLNVTLGQLLDLSAVTQYAEADPSGVSSANTSAADVGLDLLPLTGGATQALSTANLSLGAVSSDASLTGATDVTRDYSIAQANLNLTSPVVGDISTTTTNATGTLVNTLNGLGSTIQGAVNNSVGTIINAIGGITGTASTDTTVNVDASRLNTAIQNVLSAPLSTDLVTIDPSTGNITVNLAGGVDLNDLPPNSTLLSPDVLQQVSQDVATLLGQLQSNINDILDNATDYVDLSLDSHTTITAPIVGTTLGTMDLTYDGTLGDFLGGAPITATGTGVLAPVSTLGTLSSIVETAVGNAVNTTITTAVSTAGQAVDTVVTDATNALAPALTGLADVVAVNVNVQSDNSDGSYSETAVQVTLLNADGAELDLATSTVGPNVQTTYTPTLTADSPVAAGDATTVAGGGWPPNTDVTLQLTDADGNPIGDPVTVTTTADGSIPDGTTYPIPADTPPADYTLTGTTDGGTSATTTVTVTDETAPNPPVITDPADGSSTNDPTPPITGTAEPNSTVDVYEDTNGDGQPDGDPICTATTDADGNWTCTPTTPLDDGDHTIVATATDEAGNTSDPSEPVTVTVDTTAPDAPVIETPADGSTTADATPVISGTGEPGDTVNLTVDGQAVTPAEPIVVGDDGTWTYTVPDGSALADGSHTVTATQTDPAGNTSPADSTTFTVDATAPAAPVITGPTDGSTTNDNTPTVTGTGEPGATVTVTDAAGDTVCTATVDANGNWTCDSEVTFGDGDHTITATQTDEAGNPSGPSTPVTFTVDTAAPAVSIDTVDGDDASAPVTTQNPTPPIAGTTDPGSTVNVVVSDADGNQVASGLATVNPDGSWTFTPGTALGDGNYTAVATATDTAGNTADSNTAAFTVDTTAPAAPVISAPADGTTTSDNTPTISGTGEPGATVTVTDEDGNTVCTATVGTDGTWSCTPDTAFTDGDHTITATQTDPAGNTSGPSAPVAFTVDTTAPDAPVITAPEDGSTTNNRSPEITGTGEPGATVTVTDETNNATVCTTTVLADGSWSCTPDTPLDDGDHTITATQTDEAGNTSDPSDEVTFTVDTAAPDAPAITSPTDGSTITDSTPAISGTAEPNSTVDVYEDTNGDGQPDGDPICTATTDADGNWTCTPTTPLDDGDHTIVATATDEAGNTSDPSDPVTFTLDATAPDAPVITAPADGTTTSDNTPTISGTGEPGATVTVTTDDGTVLGTAVVDPQGNWTFDSTELPDGDYTITATQEDEAGNTSPASAPDSFTVDTTAPDAPTITSPTDGSTLTDSTPDISGTAEPNSTVDVYEDTNGDGQPDGDPVCTATTDADGNWTCTPTTPLDDGDHTIVATATDEAGNASDPSDPVSITVDTTAPDAPVIETPADGSATADNTPDITGTGEPGATIDLTVDGQAVTPAEPIVVGDDGTWTYTVPDGSALDDGGHTVTATQTDPAGNTSPADSTTFTVDTTAPDAPVITGPADGSTTSDTTPAISGTAEQNSTVDVYEDTDGDGQPDGDPICTATTNVDGNWTCTPTTALDEGDHTIVATATDDAGNTSDPSDSVTVTVDTSAPAVTIDTVAGSDATSPSATQDRTPTIAGTVEGANGPVTVTVTDSDGNVVATGEATADADGSWTFTPTDDLPNGNYTAVATAEDAAGNTGSSNTAAFNVYNAAPDIAAPADGSTVTNSTPTISGTGAPGSTVDVYEDTDGDGQPDGDPICTAPVQADGTWSCRPDTPLSDGNHTLTATQTDPAGNTSDPSDPVHITVDTTAPHAPVITSPSNGDTVTDNTPTVSGNGGDEGDTVTVKDEDGNTLCTATVQADGTWSCTPDTPLSEGDHTLTATETDPAGNTSAPSDPVNVTVDSTVSDPTITGPKDGATITDRTPTITGTGEPGATVTVRVDGQVLGTVKVAKDGTWSLPVTDQLAYGDHTVRAVQRDAAGNVSAAVTSAFTVAPSAPQITSPSDGDTVSDSPTVKGTGKPGAQVTVYSDGQAVGAATAGKNGAWAVSAGTLSCGTHTITASQSVDTSSARLARAVAHARVQGRAVASAMSDPVTVKVACPASATTGSGNSAASATSGSELPNTGAPSGLAALIGLGFGCIAVGVLMLARRRRDA